MAEGFSQRSRPASELSDWLERQSLDIDWCPEPVPLAPTQVLRPDWEGLRAQLAGAVAGMRNALPDALPRNRAELVCYPRLRQVEADIFLFSARAAQGEPLSGLISLVENARLPVDQTIACLAGHSAAAINGAIRQVCRKVKRRRDAKMTLRRTAAGMLEAAKGFRRLEAEEQLPVLKAAPTRRREGAATAGKDHDAQAARPWARQAVQTRFRHSSGHPRPAVRPPP